MAIVPLQRPCGWRRRSGAHPPSQGRGRWDLPALWDASRLGIACSKFHPRLALASPAAAPQRCPLGFTQPLGCHVSGDNVSPDLRVIRGDKNPPGVLPSSSTGSQYWNTSIPKVVPSFCSPSKPRYCHPPLLISQSPHTPCCLSLPTWAPFQGAPWGFAMPYRIFAM